jgi:hypothetical protein
MKDSVYYECIQCDGAEHEGCDAGCLSFWKEAYLLIFELAKGSN